MSQIVLSPEESKLLEAFERHEVRYIVVGLSAAVIHGAIVSTQDIDLWFEQLGSESFKKAVAEAGGFYIAPATAGMNPPMLGPEKFSLFDLVVSPSGLEDFAAEYEKSTEISISGVVVRVLPLERVIHSKKTANRPKDIAVLPSLEATLAATKKP